MDNDSIYSGVSAHPAREIADELMGRDFDFADDCATKASFMDLVGAVMTLAREVHRITPVVIDHDSGPSTNAEAQQQAAVEFLAAQPSNPSWDVALGDLAAFISTHTRTDGTLRGIDLTFVYRRLLALQGRAEREARPPTPVSNQLEIAREGLREVRAMGQLERVYEGLREVLPMLALGYAPGTPEHARAAGAAVVAVHGRITAMLQAGESGTHAWRRDEPANPPPPEQLALVYEGLREVLHMGTTGLTTNALRSYLVSMTERIRAMLDAAGEGPDHG